MPSNTKDNIRTCAVCRTEILTAIDKISPKKGLKMNANMRTSEEGVFFQLVNAWFCNECWKNVNRGITSEDEGILQEERKIESVKLKNFWDNRFKDMKEEDIELYDQLKKLRNNLALENKLRPFFILKNEALYYMAIRKPYTKNEMIKINGIKEKKFSLYGEKFLLLIKDFLLKHPSNKNSEDHSGKIRQDSAWEKRMTKIKNEYPEAYKPWDEKQEQSILNLFDQGKTLDEIAKIMKRQPSGIRSRLQKLGKIK